MSTEVEEAAAQREHRARLGWLSLAGSLVVPSLAVVALLFLLISVRSGVEAGMTTLSQLMPVGYAFGAGMVASVNPCGFFLLPSYASYQLGADEKGFSGASRIRRLTRALLLGLTATLGFVLLFASVGAVVSFAGTRLVSVFPFAGLAIGVGMVGLGLWLVITGRTVGIALAGRAMVTPRRNQRNVFLFGVGYAVASLCCTLPIFLVVVGSSLAAGSWVASLGQYIGYGLGMGAVLVGVTLGTALLRDTVARWVRGALPHVHRASSLFLIAAGGYVVYYWLFYADYFF